MKRRKVARVTNRRQLSLAQGSFNHLNAVRLARALTPRERYEREVLDRGLMFYSLSRFDARLGFTEYGQLREFLNDLQELFGMSPGSINMLDPWSVISQLARFGFVLKLEYHASRMRIPFDGNEEEVNDARS